MRKLLICLSLILVLTLVFVGCKDKNETPDVTETPTTEAPTTGAPATEQPTDAPVVEDPTTEEPTEKPTEKPTETPTEQPTEQPTDAPVEECTHSFPNEWTVDESVEECAGEGRLYRVCEACGEKETKADTCSFGEWTKVEGKECADEDRLTRVCSKCGKTEYSADGECTFGDPVVTEPTCEDDGCSVITCTKCGKTEEEAIDAIGHVAKEGTEWHVLLAPTCTTPGAGFGECANCGEMVDVVLEAFGHNAPEATCSAASVCATCGVTVAPALPHTTVTVEAKDPTCTEVGYVAGEYCSVCGSIDALVIPATGHSYIWAVTTAPTFVADGVNTGTCACGHTVTDTVAKRVPALMFTAEDLLAGNGVSYNNVIVTPKDGYVTLNPTAFGASVKFLLANGQSFQDIISIKYRVSADYVSFAANKDAYFNVNGKAFYASLTGTNVVDYDNEGTAGEWTLLNIDFRKSQITIDGVEYDMFNGADLTAVEYVLFNGYRDGLSIDVEYVAFFDVVAEAEEYATNHGEVATPVVYAPTEKNYNTSLNNTNGAGEYGAPGIYLNEKNNVGATIVDWNGRFFANYNLTAVGTITVDGGVQKLMYSMDGGLTWLDFAEGNAVVNNGTYTVKFDLSAFEGQTVDLRVAAVLAVDGKTTEYASVLNIRKIKVVKGNLNTLDVNYLAAAGSQKDNITATVENGYVHYVVSGISPTINLFKSETGIKVGQYMLIKYRGNGSGYGTNYDFYFDINGSGAAYNNIGGKKYAANWFNLTLDNTWNYIIVDLANGFGGKTFDMNNCTEINWIVFDGTVTAAKGDWIDIAGVQFFDTYADARAVANPNGDYITKEENGSTYSKFTYGAYATLNHATGTAKPAIERDSANLFKKVTLVAPDHMLVVRMSITSSVAFDASDIGISLDNGEILYGAVVKDGDEYQIGFPIPEDFVSGREYKASLVIKSKTNTEIVLLDEFTLVRQPEGITINDNVGKNDNKFASSKEIPVAASAKGANDVVALYKGDTLVMYYGAYSGVTGFKANGGNGITIANAGLAALPDGEYTIKLHSGSVNGAVVATETITILNTGNYTMLSARDIYNTWKATWATPTYANPGPAHGYDWGLKVELKTEANGSEYVKLTTMGTANIGAGRLMIGKEMITYTNYGAIGISYRNNTDNSFYGSYGTINVAGAMGVPAWAGAIAKPWQTHTYVNRSNWELCFAHPTIAKGDTFNFLSFDFYTGQGDGKTIDLQYIVFCAGDLNSTEGANILELYG